ncbi:hypothetical protein NBH00_08615 [Paraconexibacter antarcticus]|uniref:Cellulase (Glycosyl hydrolase family 5) n=1 Tax=Paraconexibacter antarcticus TaxID=2949664 RepID=A0ABY5E090_9ACTN|nr:hypothetical protein [Paraconexibacter antarcticus]UTI66255.1 hypothetical protein NBH00_08615 [Paraconexibacter antarcticus]
MRKLLLVSAMFVIGVLLAAIPDSGRAAPPSTVLQDDAIFLHRDPAAIQDALRRAASIGIDRIRLTAGWSVIAPDALDQQPPAGFDGSDPDAYPAHAWDNLDRAVTLVAAAGLKPMIDIGFWAPRWATASQDDPLARFRTDIDPGQFAAFAAAVARRYRGDYVPRADQVVPPPAGAAAPDLLGALLGHRRVSAPAAAPPAADPLPRVDLYTLWNEPNHPGFVLPQWRERDGTLQPDSPIRYRAMVAAAYPAVKAVSPGTTVLIGGTSSMGSSVPGRSGVPPLRFLRELACVDAQLQPITTGACADFKPVPSDGWAHHPYSLHTDPDRAPRDPDLLPVARTAALHDTLVALVQRGRLVGSHASDLYLTEYGYETKTPDPEGFASLADQARLLAWAEFLGTSTPGVKMWPQFLLEDRPAGPAGPRMRAFGDWQTGLWFADGTPKPAATAFRTPTFAQCARRGKTPFTRVWARLRGAQAGTTATVQVQSGAGWATVPSAATMAMPPSATGPVPIGDDDALLRWLPGTPAATRVVWHTPAGVDVDGPDVPVQPCPAASIPAARPHRTPGRGRRPATTRRKHGRASARADRTRRRHRR